MLATRVRASGLEANEQAGDGHPVLLSTYDRHVRFLVTDAGIAGMRRGGRMQAPVSQGGSGLAIEDVPALLLGPYGALGLEERQPDCHLGRSAS